MLAGIIFPTMSKKEICNIIMAPLAYRKLVARLARGGAAKIILTYE